MKPHTEALIQRYRQKGALIDTNLLLLCVGDFNPALIEQSKRLTVRGFTAKDYTLLKSMIGRFERVITTPNVLTEVYNLVRQDHKQKQLRGVLIALANAIFSAEERYIESKEMVGEIETIDYGLTDAVLMTLVKQDDYLLMTIDGRLYGYLVNSGFDALNFNHDRDLI